MEPVPESHHEVSGVTSSLESIQWGELQQILGLIDVGGWLLYCYTVYEYLNIRLVLTILLFLVTSSLVTDTPIIFTIDEIWMIWG